MNVVGLFDLHTTDDEVLSELYLAETDCPDGFSMVQKADSLNGDLNQDVGGKFIYLLICLHTLSFSNATCQPDYVPLWYTVFFVRTCIMASMHQCGTKFDFSVSVWYRGRF